jgi:hypothetical protein
MYSVMQRLQVSTSRLAPSDMWLESHLYEKFRELRLEIVNGLYTRMT